MEHIYTSVALALLATASHAQEPDLQWAESISNVAFMHSAACTDIAVAENGAVYINGVNGNTGFFEGSSVIENEVINGPFLARYDASGDMIWVRPGGWAITTVGSNDIYVTGDFHGTRSFGGTTFTADSVDAFLARYDANGNVIWARQMGGATRDKGMDVAVDASGQVHVAGFFTGSATFGTTTLVATKDSTGFLATYDANGDFIRAFIVGGVDNLAYNVGFSVNLDCDANGHTYLFGTFDGIASFHGTNLTSAGTNAMVLARFESNGTCTWAEQMGGSRNVIWGNGLAVSNTGNVYVLGDYEDTANFGGIILNNPLSGEVGALALYDPNGDPIWAQRVVGSASPEFMQSVALTSSGNAVISGRSLSPNVSIGSFNITIAGTGNHLAYLAEFNDAGVCQWAEELCTAERPFIAISPANDLYLAGSEQLIFGGGVSTPDVFDIDAGTPVGGSVGGFQDGFLAKYDATRDFQWLRLMGSTRVAYDSGNGIVTDADGNVYTTGAFSRSAILCADTVKRFTSTSCIYLSKRDANGDCSWMSSVCTEGSSSANAIARDTNGDLYIAGSFSGVADFGVDQLMSTTASDAFLAKYDANGNCLWATNVGGPVTCNALAANESGAIVLAGTYSTTATLGATTFTSAGSGDGFLARYAANSNFLWAKSMGGAGFDNLTGLTLDAAGNAFVTGSFSTAAIFGSIPITGTGTTDMFLAKYDDDGDAVWAQSMEGTGSKAGSALTLNDGGNILVTGAYSGTIDLGTATFTSGAGNWNTFLACYSPAGTNLWAHEIATVGYSQPSAITTRPLGDIVVGGSLLGTTTIGGTTHTSTGDYGDVLIVSFDSNGLPLWAGNWGGGLEDLGAANGVAADADFVYATGYFGTDNYDASSMGGFIDFTAGASDTTLYAPNGLDAFVVKYAIDESVSIAEANGAGVDIVIAPNPVDHSFTLSCDGAMINASTIIVRDMTGREMPVPITKRSSDALIDATGLSPGAYAVSITDGRTVLSTRFIKH